MTAVQKIKNPNKLNIFVLCMIVAFVVVGFIIDMPLSILALLANVILFVYSPTEYILYDILFLSPFASIYKLSPDTLSFFSIVEIFAVVIVLIRSKHVSIKALIGIVSFALYLAIGNLIWFNVVLIDCINPLIVLLVIYIYTDEFRILDKQKLMKYFIIGTLLTSTLALFESKIPTFYLYVRKLVYSETVIRFSGLNGDSNYYSVNLIYALVFAFLLYKNKAIKTAFIIVLALVGYFGILTYSKSFLLMYVAILGFIFFDAIVSKDNRLISLFSLMCFGVLFLIVQGKLEVVNGVLDRLTSNEGSINKLTTGRWEIWRGYMQTIFSRFDILLYGSGVNGPLINRYSPHNLYIDVLYHFGLIGTLILIFTIIICMKHKNKVNFNKYKFLGALVFFVMYFFLHGVQSYEICFHIFFIYLIYHFTLENNVNKKRVLSNKENKCYSA